MAPKGKLIPSPVLVVLATVPLGLAVATLVDASLLAVMLACDAGIAFVALVDAVLARGSAVKIRRDCARVFSIGRRNVVTLRVRSGAGRPLRVTIQDDIFESATAEGLPAKARLDAGARTRIEYSVVPAERGTHILGAHNVRYGSPLGLWIRQITLPATTSVEVYPDVQLVRTFERLAGQDRGSTMVHAHPQRGGESEFEQLRDYVAGDAYRRIDWKATARRGKLVSREYQLETDQNLLLAIDTGRLLTAETAGLSLFDHALNAALMLSHIAAKGGDRVGLLTFDHDVRSYVAPHAGAGVLQQIIRSSYSIHPRLVATDFERGVSWVATKVRKRTLVVLFTQVNDETSASELIKMVRQLTRRHLPVVVLFRDRDIDDLAEALTRPGQPTDYVAGAAAELLLWRDGVVRALRAAGVLVLDVRPGALTPRLVNAYLEVKTHRLL